MHRNWLILVLARKQLLRQQCPRAACLPFVPGATEVFNISVCVQTLYKASMEPSNEREDLQATASKPGPHQSQENTFPAEIKPMEACFHPEALTRGVTRCRCSGNHPLTPECPSSPLPTSPLLWCTSLSGAGAEHFCRGVKSPKADNVPLSLSPTWPSLSTALQTSWPLPKLHC